MMRRELQVFLDPEDLQRDAKPTVIEKIRALKLSAQAKGLLYSLWSTDVGVAVEIDDFCKVITPLERSE